MEKTEYFEYLDALRETGAVNMFGATPYLVENFNITMFEARKILVEWMETFAERNPS